MVGVGAIGRQVALMLATMGVGHLRLVDPDEVSPENMGAQGYSPCWIGDPKVTAMMEEIKSIAPDCVVDARVGRFMRVMADVEWVFCCVDDMDARRLVMDACLEGPPMGFIEARMAAESCIVFAVPTPAANPQGKDAWIHKWFPSVEAEEGPCTARTTIYNASFAASIMVSMFSKMLRGHDVPLRIEADLGEYFVSRADCDQILSEPAAAITPGSGDPLDEDMIYEDEEDDGPRYGVPGGECLIETDDYQWDNRYPEDEIDTPSYGLIRPVLHCNCDACFEARDAHERVRREKDAAIQAAVHNEDATEPECDCEICRKDRDDGW